MLQSIENNAGIIGEDLDNAGIIGEDLDNAGIIGEDLDNTGIIGEDLDLLCNYYVILLIQPSSAAAEHVFSLLENSFTKRHECSLQDYVSLSIMLQYNSKH